MGLAGSFVLCCPFNVTLLPDHPAWIRSARYRPYSSKTSAAAINHAALQTRIYSDNASGRLDLSTQLDGADEKPTRRTDSIEQSTMSFVARFDFQSVNHKNGVSVTWLCGLAGRIGFHELLSGLRGRIVE